MRKALISAAGKLGLTHAEAAQIVGASASTVSRWAAGKTELRADSKEYELALLFIRVFRSLTAIVGQDMEAAKAWLRAYDKSLRAVPAEHMKKAQGLFETVRMLDAWRAPV